MEIAHGGFEVVVAEHDLEIPYERSIMQGVGGKGVAQVMRGDAIELTTVSRLLDGALDVGFVAAPTHGFFGMGMKTGGAGGEQPSPALGMGGVGVFLGQETGQSDGDALGVIGGGKRIGDFQLLGKGCREAVRESDDPAFVALGLMDMETGLSQVEVLDAQIQGFGDAEPASVEQMDNEACGIAMHVSYRGEQLADFCWRRTVAKGGRPPGAKCIDVADFLMENIAIKEEQGAESLILGGGRNAGDGQLGEERLNLLFGCLARKGRSLRKRP